MVFGPCVILNGAFTYLLYRFLGPRVLHLFNVAYETALSWKRNPPDKLDYDKISRTIKAKQLLTISRLIRLAMTVPMLIPSSHLRVVQDLRGYVGIDGVLDTSEMPTTKLVQLRGMLAQLPKGMLSRGSCLEAILDSGASRFSSPDHEDALPGSTRNSLRHGKCRV